MDRLLEMTARAEREHFWFHGFRRFVRPLLEEAARTIEGRDARILDCGCGTGNNLRMLRRYGDATGIDLTYSGLAYARRHGERLIAQASALTLPFPDRMFDIVTSFDVIYAFDDQDAAVALKEMYRVMRPGAYLLLNVAALHEAHITGTPRTRRLQRQKIDIHERVHSAARRRRALRPTVRRSSRIGTRDCGPLPSRQPGSDGGIGCRSRSAARDGHADWELAADAGIAASNS
jgi:SAM-dependent methyltransferase